MRVVQGVAPRVYSPLYLPAKGRISAHVRIGGVARYSGNFTGLRHARVNSQRLKHGATPRENPYHSLIARFHLALVCILCGFSSKRRLAPFSISEKQLSVP